VCGVNRFGKRAEVAPENFLPPYGYQSEEVENNNDDDVEVHSGKVSLLVYSLCVFFDIL